jgi:hypothetical protein
MMDNDFRPNLTAQTYADDILLFSNSYDNISNLLGIVEDFLVISTISLNPKNVKFWTLNDEYNTLTLQDPVTKQINISKRIRMDDVIRYFGIPLGSTKIKKMKFTDNIKTKLRDQLLKLKDNGLTYS